MHRLNLTIDEALYEQARAFGAVKKKSISAMMRESLTQYLSKNSNSNSKASLTIEADDEKEVLAILSNDTFTTNKEFKNRYNL
ncbi:MAG: hypothetical protein DRG11_05210 [Epsilonproteobacteria bacterium]|nr:MAG: hypothetical protein DRG11_05210 [Campylobacterota bacterium]